MNIILREDRADDFNKKGRRCMNCGRVISEAKDLYTRRFCSVECKEEYCSGNSRNLEAIKSV